MDQTIELLWWSGCPSWERALATLREEMAALGIGEERLRVTEISGADDAENRGFPGSPTILVGGLDIQPPGEEAPRGLTCRVYRRRDGRTSPLPDPADIAAALEALVKELD